MYAVKSLVEVRTVTAAQGHDADISIHGATRDDGKGLANDGKLAVVAESRAKWLSIYVIAEDAVNALNASELAAIYKYCKNNMAVAARTYWSDKVCTRCGTVHEEACPTCDIKGCKNKKEHPKYSCSMRWKTQAVMRETIPLEEMKIILDNRTKDIARATKKNEKPNDLCK